jgi:hypothetical protein
MGIMPPGATVVPRKDSEMNSTKQTARLAGLAYLLNGVGSALGTVCIPLVRPDVAAIAKIAATELPFRGASFRLPLRSMTWPPMCYCAATHSYLPSHGRSWMPWRWSSSKCMFTERSPLRYFGVFG